MPLENAESTQARDVMVTVPTIRFGSPLREVAQSLKLGGGDAVLVLHDDGHLAGLLTERELALGAQAEAEGHPGHAGEYASDRFVIAQPEESLASVLQKMATRSARRAVVIDEGMPVGVISVLMSGPPARDASASSGSQSRTETEQVDAPGETSPLTS
jgi:signal-transduction protein with cAMP-binding, CBS, and nucleotidyltransferase domain